MNKTGGRNSSKAEAKELNITISDVENFRLLAGEMDKNLKAIAAHLDILISRTPQGLLLSGQDNDVDLAADLITQLRGVFSVNPRINDQDIIRAIKYLSSNRNARISAILSEQINLTGRKYSVFPKTFNQKVYLDAIRNNDLVFGIGPAGTGKTYLAMAMAVAALLRKEVKRIVLCRPAVEAGEKLGFLPGDLVEKVNPYLRPLYDALHDLLDYEQGQDLVARGVIEVAPLAFMRGRTLANSFVILDEAQNTSTGQMKMFLTRIGENSKCIVTGDITQIDLPSGVRSGLTEAMKILSGIDGISFVKFETVDVIRHRLVAAIIDAYEKNSV
jgi:phosphate starvation-inducible PhoH-like protein